MFLDEILKFLEFWTKFWNFFEAKILDFWKFFGTKILDFWIFFWTKIFYF
jgi:hypothetical protein